MQINIEKRYAVLIFVGLFMLALSIGVNAVYTEGGVGHRLRDVGCLSGWGSSCDSIVSSPGTFTVAGGNGVMDYAEMLWNPARGGHYIAVKEIDSGNHDWIQLYRNDGVWFDLVRVGYATNAENVINTPSQGLYGWCYKGSHFTACSAKPPAECKGSPFPACSCPSGVYDLIKTGEEASGGTYYSCYKD